MPSKPQAPHRPDLSYILVVQIGPLTWRITVQDKRCNPFMATNNTENPEESGAAGSTETSMVGNLPPLRGPGLIPSALLTFAEYGKMGIKSVSEVVMQQDLDHTLLDDSAARVPQSSLTCWDVEVEEKPSLTMEITSCDQEVRAGVKSER